MNRKVKISIIVSSLIASAPLFEAASAVTDADWRAMNTAAYAGANYDVKCLAYKKGVLYMSGSFSRLGADTIRGLVRWKDGAFDSIDHEGVTAMTVADDGTLFIGTKQDTAGKTPPYKVAKWNGSAWTNLGTGFDGPITDIDIDKAGNVYACGKFAVAGGISASSIAKWDGLAWSGVGWQFSGIVKALGIDKNGTVYAGGEFSAAVARLTGDKWLKLEKPLKKLTSNVPTSPVVNAITFDSSGNMYVAGDFDSAGAIVSQCVAKWNGSDWEGFGRGIFSVMNDVAVDGKGILYAAGEGVIAQWDGKKWVRLGAFGGYQRSYTMECDDTGRLFVGGWFDSINQTDVHNFAIWDKISWGVPFPVLDGAIRAFASDGKGTLYAAGDFTLAGGVGAGHVAKWRDGKWSALGSGVSDSNYTYSGAGVGALACDDSGRLYAGGRFSHAGGTTSRNIARWNGVTWEPLGKGVNGAVYGLAHDKRGTLFAHGAFDSAGDFAVSGIARWDGGDWYPAQAGKDGAIQVTAIGADNAGNAYAAADFYNGNIWNADIGLWKNDEWKVLSGFMEKVRVLKCNRTGDLFAGGEFGSAGGIDVCSVAKWNGSGWKPLGSGICGSVIQAIAFDANGNVYAGGGQFTAAGGVAAKNIARWNGLQWEALGSGVDANVFALECMDSTLYVGGAFNRAGDKASRYFAKVNVHDRQFTASRETGENPARERPACGLSHSVLFVKNSAPRDRILLYSANGRRLRESRGKGPVDLRALSPQLLVVRMVRDGNVIALKRVFCP